MTSLASIARSSATSLACICRCSTSAEIEHLLKTGAAAANVEFSAETCAVVAGISRGMPYLAQLLGLRILQHTLNRGGRVTSQEDVGAALERLTADATQETAFRYGAFLTSSQGDRMRSALDRIAAGRQDRWGRVAPADLEPDVLAQLVDGQVLQASPGLPGWYHIIDRPLMNQVLLLKAQRDLANSVSHDQPISAVG